MIVLSGTPTVVKQDLTDTASLRCALNDTTSHSNSIVGRRDVIDTTQTDDDDDVITTLRDVSVTSDNVEQVLSIIVMQNGVDVAAVSNTHPARVVAGGGVGNLRVVGGLGGGGGASAERG